MNWLKFIPLILRGKSIAEAYKEEAGQGKPIYLSRRFMGLVLAFIGAIVSMYFGVTLDANILSTMSDSVVTVISAVVTLYGVILGIIGIIKRKQ